MKQLKKFVAVILSLALVMAFIPVMNANLETKADENFVIISPTENQLVAAGHFDIKWSAATNGTVESYTVYLDGQKVGTTTSTFLDCYTTKVEMHQAYIVAEYADGNSETTDIVEFGISKKGLGLATDMGRNISLKNMGCSWYYNWGTGPSSGQQYKGIEYVPMVWKSTSANDFKNKINAFKNKGYKYALTFNEPDLKGQCDMEVDAVYNVWKGIDGITGINISSPVTALWPQSSPDWFQTFMRKIDLNNDREVDFISIHCYPDNYGGAGMADWFLEEVVDWTWNTYRKPIWITEFSTTGPSITATGGNGTKEFWERVMPGLDSREYVERYAAFNFNNYNTGLWLYDTGQLTPAGEVYRDQGNPEGYMIEPEVEPDFTYTFSTRGTLLPDSLTVNSVLCEDYVKAEGVTATASSANAANSDGDKAIDEDITSRWESKHNIDPQTLTIDLGQIRNIKQVGIIWEAASAENYKIEVSNDGVNFTQVALVEDGNGNQNRFDTIKLKKMVQAQYVRVYGISRATNYGYSIYDLAIYGTDDEKVDETTTKEPVTTKAPIVTTEGQNVDSGKKLSVLNGATFVGYVGSWAGSNGSVTVQDNGDATVKIINSGGGWNEAKWGIQAQYLKIAVVPGNTYKYTATILSDKNKKVTVKTTPTGVDEPLVEDIITLQAGVPYTYVAEFVAASNTADIVYAFGSPEGEASVTNANIKITGNDIVVTKEKPTPPPVAATTEETATTINKSGVSLGKTKVIKASKKRADKKVKITLKKIKGAQKYQVQISKTRSFKSKLVKKTVKKVRFTLINKKLKDKKKLYVRSRAMSVVRKKYSYGKWSAVKKINIKK